MGTKPDMHFDGASSAQRAQPGWNIRVDPMLVGAEDYNLWLRICKSGWKVVGHPGVPAAYTPAEDSITSRIEQCAAAELHNARKLGDILPLDPALERGKSMATRTDFGRRLLHHRKMATASQDAGATCISGHEARSHETLPRYLGARVAAGPAAPNPAQQPIPPRDHHTSRLTTRVVANRGLLV